MVSAVTSIFEVCKNILKFYLSRLDQNNIGDDGMKNLSQEGLRHCPLLTELWYPCLCSLKEFNVEFSELMKSLSNLLNSFNYNNIGDHGMMHLSQEGLRYCPLLTVLG